MTPLARVRFASGRTSRTLAESETSSRLSTAPVNATITRMAGSHDGPATVASSSSPEHTARSASATRMSLFRGNRSAS